MSLDQALGNAQEQIPECVAVGYVDMTIGMLLGVRTVDSHPSEVLDLVAAATVELFQGKNVAAIEGLFERRRGASGDGVRRPDEVLIFSQNLVHVFARGKKNTDHAVVFVCRGSANVGMVLTKSRLALSSIEAAV
jgi:hypothetical protein